MLYFRSEEHVDRWCGNWRMDRGASFSLEKGWALARAWYGEDRRDPLWRRRTVEEAEALLESLDFRGSFWQLR